MPVARPLRAGRFKTNASRSDVKYWAFISYNHSDERWATWVHRSLETYKVPRPLVGTKGPNGVTVRPARLFPLFRDREELASASSLSVEIEGALRMSRNLILICSPRAARSKWVNEEVKPSRRWDGETASSV